jgi:hypothetical protein
MGELRWKYSCSDCSLSWRPLRSRWPSSVWSVGFVRAQPRQTQLRGLPWQHNSGGWSSSPSGRQQPHSGCEPFLGVA